jgi:hypothetical protein
MANTIILKRSATPAKVPTTAQIALGEIAINTNDGKIFIKKDDGVPTIVEIGAVKSVNGSTGAVVLDTDSVSEGSAQYFTNARARSAISGSTGISYNSGTGVISTSQNIATSASPTFAGLTLTGNMGITGNIVPSADITYDLGSPSYQWKDIYVGPGSLYVNGSKVLQDDTGTITFSADLDQNIRIKTTGNGILQLGSSSTTLQIDSTMQLTAGKRITSSDGVKVQFGDDLEMNNNKIIGVGAPSASTDAATKGYVDTAVGNISTSSIAAGNTNIAVVDTGTGVVTVTVDGSTALTVNSSGVTVAGDFTVSGTTTTVNSNTINLADNIITLNSDATGAPSQNAGIEVERGDEANVQIRWNEGTDKWTFTNDGASYAVIPTSTADLTEVTNLYYTDARARAAVSASTSTGVAYSSSTGVISLSGIPNASLANNSITINGASVALGGTRTLVTSDVAESGSLYYTDARARAAVSAGTGISYNSTTGVITNTITQYTDALAVSANASAIATAKSEAISSAATDATTKANAAKPVAGTGISVSGVTVSSTITQYTDALARGAVSAGTGISYNSTTGVITNTITQYTDALARGAVSAGTGISYNSSTGAISSTITQYTDSLARAAHSFTAGSGAYNSTTGVITIPTNTNQLTNGAGFVTSSGVTAVTATGPVVSSGGATPAISMPAATASVDGYMTSTFASKLNGIAAGATNVTNTNQLTNGAGFVTSSGVTSVATGNGLTGGTITSTGTLSLSGSYSGTWAVSGAITATGEVTAYYSDANLKKDIVEITNPIEKVMSLRGVTFRPNQTALDLGITDKEEVGVIAQEVEAVLPQLVTPSAFAGYKTVKYDKLTALLLEAVKAQQLQIDALRAEIAKLGGSATTEL